MARTHWVQARYIKGKATELAVRNAEVERAVNELVDLVQAFPRENADVHLGENEVTTFRRHYSRLMYQAILAATKASFNAMKKRLGSRASGGFLFVERPIFDVEVQLTIPSVSMSPSLDDIQGAVNTTAKKVLRVAHDLPLWGGGSDAAGARTFYDLIAGDREIVKSVLLLTGSIEGLKNQVMEYVSTFGRYDFLWKLDLAAEYATFMKSNPTLEQFEAEMKKYMAIEQEIATIAPTHNIGALSLYTAPLKYSLKAEAASWKAQFAKNLHSQGFEDLKAMHEYMRETTLKLSRKIEDLEDVRMARCPALCPPPLLPPRQSATHPLSAGLPAAAPCLRPPQRRPLLAPHRAGHWAPGHGVRARLASAAEALGAARRAGDDPAEGPARPGGRDRHDHDADRGDLRAPEPLRGAREQGRD